jgi:hypothetical protein
MLVLPTAKDRCGRHGHLVAHATQAGGLDAPKHKFGAESTSSSAGSQWSIVPRKRLAKTSGTPTPVPIRRYAIRESLISANSVGAPAAVIVDLVEAGSPVGELVSRVSSTKLVAVVLLVIGSSWVGATTCVAEAALFGTRLQKILTRFEGMHA